MIRGFTVRALITQLPADVKVIPGHGALSNLDDVREFTKMLKETSAVVQKALAEHKTLEQMKQEKILDPWKKWSGDFVNADAFIETLYKAQLSLRAPPIFTVSVPCAAFQTQMMATAAPSRRRLLLGPAR